MKIDLENLALCVKYLPLKNEFYLPSLKELRITVVQQIKYHQRYFQNDSNQVSKLYRVRFSNLPQYFKAT